MLRSLGSSLVAKSSPGSKSREIVENRLNSTTIPDKGDPGSVQRSLMEETKVQPVAPGSEKQIRVSPGVSAVQGMDDPGMGLIGPENPALAGGAAGPRQNYNPAALRSGANSQALLQGGEPGSPPPAPAGNPASASAAPRSGRSATAVSSAGAGSSENLLAGIMGTGNVDSGPRQNYQVEKPQDNVEVGNYKFQPLGGRVSADGGQGGAKTISGNTLQAVAGTLSKAAEKVGGGNIPSVGLRSFAQNVSQAANPIFSPAAALQSVNKAASQANPIGSAVSGFNNLRSQASNVLSKLRSLFK